LSSAEAAVNFLLKKAAEHTYSILLPIPIKLPLMHRALT
jgi:hypothetical protein